jgi:hypothetical protein
MKSEPQNETFADQLAETEDLSASLAAPTKKSVNTWSVLRNRNYALLFWGQFIFTQPSWFLLNALFLHYQRYVNVLSI